MTLPEMTTINEIGVTLLTDWIYFEETNLEIPAIRA